MKENDFVRVKSRNVYGIVLLSAKDKPSLLQPCRRFNLVLLEDNTMLACTDEDLELVESAIEE